MSRTAKFLTGVRLGYLTQGLTTAVGLWLTPFLLRHLGTHDYGLWLTVTQILAYLLLLDVGIIALVPREVAWATGRAKGDGVHDEVREVLGRSLAVVLLQLPFIALAAWATWRWLPAQWAEARPVLGWVLVVFVACYPFRVAGAALEGMQEFRTTGRVALAAWAGQVVTSVAFVSAGFGLQAVVWAWAVQQLVVALANTAFLVGRHSRAVPWRLARVDAATLRDRFSRGAWASVSQVSTVLLFGTDVLLISRILGPAAVVSFDVTRKLVIVLANQPQMLMHASMPALSQLRAAGDRERLARVISALGVGVLCLSGAVVFLVALLNGPFVAWWVGAGRFGGEPLTLVLLLVMFVRHWATTMGYANFSFGRERDVALVNLADGIASVACGAVLVRLVGPIGAPLGALAGVLLLGAPMAVRILAAELEVGAGALLRPLAPLVVRLALLLAVGLPLVRLWPPHGLVQLAAWGAALSLAYGVVMLPVLLRSSLAEWITPRLPHRARRALRAVYGAALLAPHPTPNS